MSGFPAACVYDFHACPQVSGTAPHIGGPILPPCADKELIEGRAAARITDIALCCMGPPDIIAEGEPTVLVQGLPLARVGALTAHGGVVVGPGANTVLLGPPKGKYPKSVLKVCDDGTVSFVTKVAPNITIDATGSAKCRADPAVNAQFNKEVMKCIETIQQTPTGRRRLEDLEISGKNVTIVPNSAHCESDLTPEQRAKRDADLEKNQYAPKPGEIGGGPTDVKIGFDPREAPPDLGKPWHSKEGTPPDVTLFHEMTHADDMVYGRQEPDFVPKLDSKGKPVKENGKVVYEPNVVPNGDNYGWDRKFDPANEQTGPHGAACEAHEARAVGLGQYRGDPEEHGPYYPTENDYRRDRNRVKYPPVPERTSYP